MSPVAICLGVAGVAFALAAASCGLRWSRGGDGERPLWACAAIANGLYCATFWLAGQQAVADVMAFGAGLSVLLWLTSRPRRRKRASRTLGGRARARIAAMLSVLRERTAPRPVLRPLPLGGGR